MTGPTSITLKWEPATADNCVISKYEINLTIVDDSQDDEDQAVTIEVEAPSDPTAEVVKEVTVKPDVEYEVTISAVSDDAGIYSSSKGEMILERLSADVLGKVLQKMKPSKEALILRQLRECVADGCLDRKEDFTSIGKLGLCELLAAIGEDFSPNASMDTLLAKFKSAMQRELNKFPGPSMPVLESGGDSPSAPRGAPLLHRMRPQRRARRPEEAPAPRRWRRREAPAIASAPMAAAGRRSRKRRRLLKTRRSHLPSRPRPRPPPPLAAPLPALAQLTEMGFDETQALAGARGVRWSPRRPRRRRCRQSAASGLRHPLSRRRRRATSEIERSRRTPAADPRTRRRRSALSSVRGCSKRPKPRRATRTRPAALRAPNRGRRTNPAEPTPPADARRSALWMDARRAARADHTPRRRAFYEQQDPRRRLQPGGGRLDRGGSGAVQGEVARGDGEVAGGEGGVRGVVLSGAPEAVAAAEEEAAAGRGGTLEASSRGGRHFGRTPDEAKAKA